MAKGSAKKPGDPKCRACGGLLEGRPMVRVGGNSWHRECAEKQGKFIPVEYREGYVKKTKATEETQPPAEEAVEAAEVPEGAEAEAEGAPEAEEVAAE